MPGANCALYGCSTSRKSGLLLFKLPFPRAGDGEESRDESFEGDCAQRMAACDTLTPRKGDRKKGSK